MKYLNFLNVPGPIRYQGTDYIFDWSSNPNATYFKQEYHPAGQPEDRYTEMIMLEVALGEIRVSDAVAAKQQEIEQRKGRDKMANYNLSENKEKGEMLLEFMMSEGSRDDTLIVEWNVYRYHAYSDSFGRKGVQLFALSRRCYGKKSKEFLDDIREDRLKYMNDFVALPVPELKLPK